MLESKKILANTLPDPVQSARKLVWASLLAIAFLTFMAVLLPIYGTVLAAVGVLPIAIGIWARKRIAEFRRDEREWSKNRFFKIAKYPIHPEDAREEREDAKRPLEQREGYWWRQPGPGIETIPTEETVTHPDGSTSQRRLWRRRLKEDDRPWVMALVQHCRRHHESVYRIVEEWWERECAERVTGQLFPGRNYRELAKTERQGVNLRCESEFLQGICVALLPSTWDRKFDRRPSHIHLSRLREILARRILAVGGYPNQARLADADRLWRWRHRNKHIYLGEGFNVYTRHASKYYYRRFADGDDWKVPPDPMLGGDPRFFATGWRESGPVWTHYDRDLPQHSIFFGGTGMGKTRGVESTVISAIRNGSAVVILDPKVDERLLSLAAYHAKRVGREDDLMFLSVGRPELPYNNTFNPLSGYNDPSEIGSRIGAFLPRDAGENQYFVDEAKKVARVAGTVCHWICHYLATLSGGNKRAKRAPKLLCWLTYVEHAGLWIAPDENGQIGEMPPFNEVQEAYQAFGELYERMCVDDDGFDPNSELEAEVFETYRTEEFAAAHWIPSCGHIQRYAIEARQRLISWMVRIVYYHALVGVTGWNDRRSPLRDTRAHVLGIDLEEGQQSLLTIWQRAGAHPIGQQAPRDSNDMVRQWRMFYEVCVDANLAPELNRTLDRLQRISEEHLSQVRREDEEYQKATTNLSAPISLLVSGEKSNLLNDPDPDISWRTIHTERRILLAATGVMKDRDAANSVAKALTSSLLAYGGYIQDTGGDDIDLVFVGDEMPSWATEDWSDITDKLRGSGVRTLGLTQSRAGSRHAIGSDDLVKHIDTNMKNRYTCASPSNEDAEAFVEQMPKVIVYKPKRNLTENPALGDSGHREVAEWSTGETWSWDPEEAPLVDKDFVSRIPRLQMLRFVQGEVTLFQVPIVHPAPYSYLAEIGMHEKSRPAEVAGIDYPVEEGPGDAAAATWGTAASFSATVGVDEAVAFHDDPLPPESVPTSYGLVDVSSELARQEIWLAEQGEAVSVEDTQEAWTEDDDEDEEHEDDPNLGWVASIPTRAPTPAPTGNSDPLERELAEGEQRLVVDGHIYIGQVEDDVGREGEWLVYDQAGNLMKTVEYREDRIDGNVVHFWPGGQVRRREVWEDGECLMGHDYDESGHPVEAGGT